mmetsp:Transcript_19042/g.62071  ORF Transcript_19042/g.62071 Transcript_19042/m.62071 type:complete len:240 (-) Transcript_19042:704-1423(-)
MLEGDADRRRSAGWATSQADYGSGQPAALTARDSRRARVGAGTHWSQWEGSAPEPAPARAPPPQRDILGPVNAAAEKQRAAEACAAPPPRPRRAPGGLGAGCIPHAGAHAHGGGRANPHAHKDTESGFGTGMVPRGECERGFDFASVYSERHAHKDTASVFQTGMRIKKEARRLDSRFDPESRPMHAGGADVPPAGMMRAGARQDYKMGPGTGRREGYECTWLYYKASPAIGKPTRINL